MCHAICVVGLCGMAKWVGEYMLIIIISWETVELKMNCRLSAMCS